MRDKRKAILHIGVEKTGSTSIQQALAGSRDQLRAAGVLFPKSAGPKNHTRLVASCLDDDVFDNVKANNLARTGLDSTHYRASFLADFQSELGEGPDWDTLVISSELISSRLHVQSEVMRLISLLLRYVAQIEVVVFLRRQDRLAVSRFSSALRAGHSRYDGVFNDLSSNSFLSYPQERPVNDMTEFFDYDRLLARFEGLGKEVTVTPHIYDPPSGRCDPVLTLLSHLGPAAETVTLPEGGAMLNPAMSAAAAWVIAVLNADQPPRLPSGERDGLRQALLRRVEAEVKGDPRKVPRTDAEEFLARFASSNEAVRKRYFSRQVTLFDGNFGDLPAAVDDSDLEIKYMHLVTRYRAEWDAGRSRFRHLHRLIGKGGLWTQKWRRRG